MVKEKNAILDRQHTPNPLMDLLIGAVARLDEASSFMEVINSAMKDGEPPVPPALEGWVTDKGEFISAMEVAGVFEKVLLKVQRPVTSNDPEALKEGFVLVYNEDHSLMAEVIVGPEIYEWFDGDYKMYTEARLWASGPLQIVRRVEEQTW